MQNHVKGRALFTAALLLGGIAIMPASALAGDEDRARAAVAAAKGRIDAADQSGAGQNAGEVLAQARQAATEAETLVKKKDNEDASWHRANEATALADLAIAKSELRKLEQQRDQLRATQ